MLRVSSRNARFQQFQALIGNRGKRQRNREFLVQGVRPITLAAEFGWPFRVLIYDAERQLSAWARDMLADVPALHVAMSPGLLAELGEKEAGPPELVAVVGMPDDDLDRITASPSFLGVVLDRPASPGNVGSIIRSADAFGADGIIVTVFDADFTGPVLLLVGNETTGLTSAWRDLCDLTVRIPITGAASSLNAATAATVILYEAARQRSTARRGRL